MDDGSEMKEVVSLSITEEELLLLENKITKFLKRNLINLLGVSNPKEIARLTVLADMPLMSKLWNYLLKLFIKNKFKQIYFLFILNKIKLLFINKK